MAGKKRKYAVLGHDIGYTLSPRLHRTIFAYLDENGEYEVADVGEYELESTVKRLLSTCDGFNVTKPYKESVAKLLGCEGPVNTVRSDGRATSTDADGFLRSYIEEFGAPCGRVLMLGAGGAAKSVADALRDERNVEDICIYNRTFERAELMAGGKIRAVKDASGKYDIVINCTSLGLGGEMSAPAELDFTHVKYAYDLVYSPPETSFIHKARENGARACNGLGMLVWQAIAAHEFWRDERFTDKMRASLAAFVRRHLITK